MSSPISPDLYNEIIRGVKPIAIRLVSVKFDRIGKFDDGLLKVQAFADPASQKKFRSSVYLASQQVSFQVLTKDDSCVVAEGECKFEVKIEVSTLPPPEFWTIFLKRNMPLYLNPAVRDLVAGLCMRADLRSEVLPSIPVVPNMFPPRPTQTS